MSTPTPSTRSAISSPPSTPPSPSCDFDDVFASRSPSPETARPLPPDLYRLRTTHVTSGYRDGISETKTSSIQPGFDESYPLGGRIGLKLGWALGVVSALCAAFPEDRALVKMRAAAERECDLMEVISAKWWEEDGNWKWTVEKEEGATLDEVVEAFPVWRKWRRVVMEECEKKELDVGILGEDEEAKEVVESC